MKALNCEPICDQLSINQAYAAN